MLTLPRCSLCKIPLTGDRELDVSWWVVFLCWCGGATPTVHICPGCSYKTHPNSLVGIKTEHLVSEACWVASFWRCLRDSKLQGLLRDCCSQGWWYSRGCQHMASRETANPRKSPLCETEEEQVMVQLLFPPTVRSEQRVCSSETLCNTYLLRVLWETVEMLSMLCSTMLSQLSNK